MRIATTWIALTISGLMVAATGCSNQSTPANPAAGTSPDPRQVTRQLLAADPQLATSVDVSGNPDGTQLTLSGTVPTEQLRNEAVNMAKQASPNGAVIDRIEVRPAAVARNDYTPDMAEKTRENAKVVGDKIGQSLDDAWLYTKVEAKLLGDADLPRKINVDVVDKVVVLRGEVNAPVERQEAERIAKSTDGVRGVRNLLKVNS